VPSHLDVPQGPEPPQRVRGILTGVQTPGVCLHDWHCPVQALSQQTPSAMWPLVHSSFLVAGVPFGLGAKHFFVVLSQ
jgi:hypothetical protein